MKENDSFYLVLTNNYSTRSQRSQRSLKHLLQGIKQKMTIVNFDFQFTNNFAISSIYPNKKTNRKWFAKNLEDNSKKKKQDIVYTKKQVKKDKKIITSNYSDTSSDNDIMADQYLSDYEDCVVDYSDYDSSPFDLD